MSVAFPDLKQADVEWHTFEWKTTHVQPWQPGLVVQTGDLIRPTVPNGFFFEVTTAGELAGREPNWNTIAAATTPDGSAVFTARTPAAASEPTILSCTYAMSPAGLVEDSVAIDNDRMETRIRIDATGADLGTYTITATMTDSSGEDHIRSASLTVVA